MIYALILVGIVFTLLLIAFLFPIVQICGYSMFPTFVDGEFCLSRRVFRKSKCECGEVYVYRVPYESDEVRFVIKRLHAVDSDTSGKTRYYFLGDNADDSYDSRYYGWVDSRNVVAKIVKKRGVKNEEGL